MSRLQKGIFETYFHWHLCYSDARFRSTGVPKVVRNPRNKLGTVPKTFMKLKQTILVLCPDDFSYRLFRNLDDYIVAGRMYNYVGLLDGFGSAHQV